MAQTNFAPALTAVLAHEGGYVDHPVDPGGATNLGITRKTLARWRKVSPFTSLPKSEVKALTKATVAPIYRAFYWDEVRGDDLPSGLDYAVFDYAVNSGPGRAAMALQRLVDVADDGEIGPLTLAAIAQCKPSDLINALCDERLAFLRRLSTFGTFGKGWTIRVASVRATALEIVKGSVEPVAVPKPAPPPKPIPTVPLPAPAEGNGPPVGIIIAIVFIALAVAAAFFWKGF